MRMRIRRQAGDAILKGNRGRRRDGCESAGIGIEIESEIESASAAKRKARASAAAAAAAIEQ
jgi:hypothetical protein